MKAAEASGERAWAMPTVAPSHLADLLAAMHESGTESEATYPDGLFTR